MKIYIAGPISGVPDCNRSFDACADKLRADGHTVLTPMILPKGLDQHEYMDICFAMIRAADALHFLNGWENSKGAVAEYHYASKIGKSLSFE